MHMLNFSWFIGSFDDICIEIDFNQTFDYFNFTIEKMKTNRFLILLSILAQNYIEMVAGLLNSNITILQQNSSRYAEPIFHKNRDEREVAIKCRICNTSTSWTTTTTQIPTTTTLPTTTTKKTTTTTLPTTTTKKPTTTTLPTTTTKKPITTSIQTTTVEKPKPKCMKGFILLDDGHCYAFIYGPYRREEAGDACNIDTPSKSHVWLPQNLKEHNTVVEFIKKTFPRKKGWYLGSVRQSYIWVDTTRKDFVNWSNWANGSPPVIPPKGDRKKCLIMKPADNYKWHSVNCRAKYSVVCKQFTS